MIIPLRVFFAKLGHEHSKKILGEGTRRLWWYSQLFKPTNIQGEEAHRVAKLQHQYILCQEHVNMIIDMPKTYHALASILWGLRHLYLRCLISKNPTNKTPFWQSGVEIDMKVWCPSQHWSCWSQDCKVMVINLFGDLP